MQCFVTMQEVNINRLQWHLAPLYSTVILKIWQSLGGLKAFSTTYLNKIVTLMGRRFLCNSASRFTVIKSVSRNGGYFCWQIYWLSPNLPAEMAGISTSRFTVTKSIGRNVGVFQLADSLTVTKSVGRFTDCHQVYWQKCGGISTGRFTDCHQICWQIYWLSPSLLAEMWGYFNWQIHWLSPNLLADLLTVTKSAGRNTLHFCW